MEAEGTSMQDLSGALAEPSLECRLCFEGGGELIAPCDCAGSMAWVHRSCLNQWRYHGQPLNAKAMTHCATCAYEYRLRITFDIEDEARRRGKRRRRFCRDFLLVFLLVQAGFFLMALLIFLCDRGGQVDAFFGRVSHRPHLEGVWLKRFLEHHAFHYYSAAVVLVLFVLGLGAILLYMVQFCCPRLFLCQVREPRIRYRQNERCIDDCCRSCVCYDPGFADPTCCFMGCDGCFPGACICDGEGAIVLLVLAVVAVILLGLFVALFLFTAALQRMGQRYLRTLHLRDVAERFAVECRATRGLANSGDSAVLQESGAQPPRPVQADAEVGQPSQEMIHRMLQQEILATRGILGH